MSHVVELVSHAIADSFLGIGVLVAAMLAVISVARSRGERRWDRWLVNYPKAGPAVAAVLSLPPGCSGVVITVTLYGERRVTFGTVVAAMLATMGDSAWVLIAADPVLAAQLKLSFLIGGAIGGYAVDALHLEPRARQLVTLAHHDAQQLPIVTTLRNSANCEFSDAQGSRLAVLQGTSTTSPPPIVLDSPAELTRGKNPKSCCVTSSEARPSRGHPSSGFEFIDAVFWLTIAVGLIFVVPMELLGIDEDVFDSIVGSFGFVTVGVFGFVCSAVALLRKRDREPPCRCVDDSTILAALGRTTHRAAALVTIITTVSISAVLLVETVGLDIESLIFYGLFGVLLAAMLGIVPSCGIEVMVAGLFVAGVLPLGALLAYLISHNGAGLLPLLAIHRQSAMASVLITTSVAIIVGSMVVLIG